MKKRTGTLLMALLMALMMTMMFAACASDDTADDSEGQEASSGPEYDVSEHIIEDSYKGSLPSFIAAFISRKSLSAEDAEEIQKMIDAFKKEV